MELVHWKKIMAKNKKPILNELFETRNSHSEEAEEIKKEDFIKTIKSRRSVRNYNDEPVLEQDMKACLELALLAPNSSNLQPWEFYWVRSPEKNKNWFPIAWGNQRQQQRRNW